MEAYIQCTTTIDVQYIQVVKTTSERASKTYTMTPQTNAVVVVMNVFVNVMNVNVLFLLHDAYQLLILARSSITMCMCLTKHAWTSPFYMCLTNSPCADVPHHGLFVPLVRLVKLVKLVSQSA